MKNEFEKTTKFRYEHLNRLFVGIFSWSEPHFYLLIANLILGFQPKLEKSALPYFLNFISVFSLFRFNEFLIRNLARKLENFPNR